MEPTYSVGLVGVTGYTGMELLRLLLNHPSFTLSAVTSRSHAGKRLDALFPYLQGTDLKDLNVIEPDPKELAQLCELVFLAVPHGTAMEIGSALASFGVKVVDLSADFRLKDVAVYEQWYDVKHTQSELLEQAVYGLPEIYSETIANAQIVANPGCYPTSAILGLYPAVEGGFISLDQIVIDSKSGTTGAGRTAKQPVLFCEVTDTFKAYGLGRHRHTPEIEQELSFASNKDVVLSFNTHLLPINRGILSTMYTTLVQDVDIQTLQTWYESFYSSHPWVRVLPQGTLPETKWVRGTMFCDIALVSDPRTNRLLILSAIDNLCRGASGQAIANANLMLDLPLDTGLKLAPLMP